MTTPGRGAVSYLCPRCHAALTAKAEDAGQRQECPHCGKTLKVPGTSPSPTQPPAVSRPEAAKPTPAPSVAGLTNIAVRCPVCGTRLYAAREQAGKSLVCPDCLETVAVPPASPGTPVAPGSPTRSQVAQCSVGQLSQRTGGESRPRCSEAGQRRRRRRPEAERTDRDPGGALSAQGTVGLAPRNRRSAVARCGR